MLFFLAGIYAGKMMDDKIKSLLQTLKLSDENAKSNIFSNISSSGFYLPNIRELKSITLGEQSSMVGIIGNYVKEYTGSEDFKLRYNEYRESRKPSPPEAPKSADEMKNQQKEELKKSIEEMKVAKSEVAADQQGMYDDMITMFEEQLKQLDDPDNPVYSEEMDNVMQESYRQQMEAYNQEVAEWEKEYPANNPNGMIKKWITELIEKSKNVDFNAQTAIDEKGRTLFVKQEYESKDNFWKLCFRAGKETTEEARRFAQTWLSELK